MTETTSIQALTAFLLSRTSITAIVGTRVFRAGGVAFNELGTKIVCHSISRTRPSVLDQEASGIVKERFQVNCWGGGSAPGRTAVSLAAVVSKRYADGGINGFRGDVTYTDDDGVSHTLTVLRLAVADMSDLFVSPWDADQKGADGVAIDIDLTYRE